MNAQPLLGHIRPAAGSQLTDDFGHRALRLHYSGGFALQLTGEAAFLETAFRIDRVTVRMIQQLNDNRDTRNARVQYTGFSVPLLVGFRVANNTSGRYQLFGVLGGAAQWYQASSMSYDIRSVRPFGTSVSLSSSNARDVWQRHTVSPPTLNVWQRAYALEAGFRVRINVRKVGRIEYGLTYEVGIEPREGIEIAPTQGTEATQRLVPRVNAFRINLAYYLMGWSPKGGWKRVSNP